MFTLSKFNAPDLIEVMERVAKSGFIAFSFARFSRPENMDLNEYKEQMFSPLEYKHFLEEIFEAQQKICSSYPNFKFVFKDHLWKLFFYEKFKKEPNNVDSKGIVIGGCSLGIATLSILSDGTVYACRRFRSPIGKVPDQSILDIFLSSKDLDTYRDFSNYQKCSQCPLVNVCRGCGAVSYGVTGSFFSPDPQCWFGLK